MSTQHREPLAAADHSEEDVARYLQAHPEFFERHPELLDRLRLPHRIGGPAVSLVERQVENLRARNRKLERRLAELVAIARDNEEISGKIHGLTCRLLAAPGLRERLAALEAELREHFEVDQAVLVLFGHPEQQDRLALGRFLSVVPAGDDTLRPFATLLDSGSPRCGQIRDAQRNFLFGEDTNEIGSAALLPLGDRGHPRGILALGSREATHFNPGNSTDFLRRIAEVVSAALEPY